MELFNWWKFKTEPKKSVEGQLRTAVKQEEIASSKVQLPTAAPKASSLLFSLHTSEKASRLAARGTSIFNVPIHATKSEICKAVERQYQVKVVRVNLMRGEGKVVRRGRQVGRRPRWKRALVTLKAGQHIEPQKSA